jgi:hypothetical protein
VCSWRAKADAPDDAPDELALAGFFVEQCADIVDTDDAADTGRAEGFVYGDLGEDCAPGVLRVLFAVLVRLGGGRGLDGLAAVAGEHDGEVFAGIGSRFAEDFAAGEVEVAGLGSVERGLGIGGCCGGQLQDALLAGCLDGRGYAGGALRSAGYGCLGKHRIAQFSVNFFDRHFEGV